MSSVAGVDNCFLISLRVSSVAGVYNILLLVVVTIHLSHS